MTPERIVHDIFVERKLTLAVAESCAGGLVSHRITNIPGSSLYFKGAIVAYSNEAKTSLLKVPEGLIKEHGAVSAEVAAAMALGVKRVLRADVAASVTGIAGPGGGTDDKPVGLAYMAVAMGNDVTTCMVEFDGERAKLKERFADAVLKFIVERTAGI